MADAESVGDDRSLLVWTVASFNAALLVAIAVGLLYAVGGLGDRLAALDTSIGVVAYLYLWGVTWWTNGRWLHAVDSGLLSGAGNAVDVSVGALRWGAVAGVLVFAPAFIAVTVLVAGNADLAAIPFLALGAGIGGLLAAGVGAIVGGVLGLVDILLARAGRGWLPDTGRVGSVEPETDTP